MLFEVGKKLQGEMEEAEGLSTTSVELVTWKIRLRDVRGTSVGISGILYSLL